MQASISSGFFWECWFCLIIYLPHSSGVHSLVLGEGFLLRVVLGEDIDGERFLELGKMTYVLGYVV